MRMPDLVARWLAWIVLAIDTINYMMQKVRKVEEFASTSTKLKTILLTLCGRGGSEDNNK